MGGKGNTNADRSDLSQARISESRLGASTFPSVTLRPSSLFFGPRWTGCVSECKSLTPFTLLQAPGHIATHMCTLHNVWHNGSNLQINLTSTENYERPLRLGLSQARTAWGQPRPSTSGTRREDRVHCAETFTENSVLGI